MNKNDITDGAKRIADMLEIKKKADAAVTLERNRQDEERRKLEQQRKKEEENKLEVRRQILRESGAVEILQALVDQGTVKPRCYVIKETVCETVVIKSGFLGFGRVTRNVKTLVDKLIKIPDSIEIIDNGPRLVLYFEGDYEEYHYIQVVMQGNEIIVQGQCSYVVGKDGDLFNVIGLALTNPCVVSRPTMSPEDRAGWCL